MKNQILQMGDLDLNGNYTYADYLNWRFEERVEIIKGKVFKMSPSPNTVHRMVSGNLLGLFWNYLKGKSYKLFHAPTDVRLITKGLKWVYALAINADFRATPLF